MSNKKNGKKKEVSKETTQMTEAENEELSKKKFLEDISGQKKKKNEVVVGILQKQHL